jgi:hypothetical protein
MKIKMKIKMLVALFFLGMSTSTYAGFGWIEDGIKDVGGTIEDGVGFVYEEVWKPLGDFYVDLYDGIGDLFDADDGIGDDELVIRLTDFYMSDLDNSNLSLIEIEGTGPSFAWVPIVSNITIFIPVFGSRVAVYPSYEEIWNDTDVDDDGIYDDVEVFLAKKFSTNNNLRLSGYRMASSVKQMVQYFENNGNEFKTAMSNFQISSTCLRKFGTDAESALIKVRIISNIQRLKSVLKMNDISENLFLNLNRNNDLACNI